MDLYSKLSTGMEEIVNMFKTRMDKYESELQKVTSAPSFVHPDVASLSREFSDFELFVWKSLSMMKSQMELLSHGLDQHETASRRKVLLFHGVAEDNGEKIKEVFMKILSDRMKIVDVSQSDIQVCHRLGISKGKSRPILVRFVHYNHRLLVWDAKTTLKNTGITISEFLTKPRHQLFIAARKHFGINRCWSSEGKIVISLPDKSRRKIERINDLQSLITQYPSHQTSIAKMAIDPGTPEESACSQESLKIRRTRTTKVTTSRNVK